ncbi:acetyltransferase [Shewanella holmiensis]|uniref:Acetyltransferase n=1 Tax=Shewanella holmiensis TaxID=2952222 RepID=A0A9X2WM38_9GAMM|nr:acetyltransferase [Shewanella holmiensis]MCT7941665.1 acetyltransferase [Shewanella holmiensis]
MNKPLIMIGSGGHASVLMDSLNLSGERVIAYISPNKNTSTQVFEKIQHLSNDEDINQFNPDDVLLVNGIGSMPKHNNRENVATFFTKLGFSFTSVISPLAIVSPSSKLARGVQVMHGAIIQAGACIGEGSIINTGAIIEHDCVVGANNHIAPRATLCGGVQTLNNVHVGVHACVIQGVNIGDHVIVGAGATVIKNIEDKAIVYGHRALIIKKE